MLELSNIFKKAPVLGIALILVLSAVNAADENYGVGGIIILIFFSVVAPTLALVIASFAKNQVKKPLLLQIGAYVVLVLGVVTYGYYVVDGKTDPNTAAHMHVYFFPIIYTALSLIIMFVFWLVGFISNKDTNKSLETKLR
jgi:predicted neutral ceramidase superfamily lipid hydrolase